MSERIIGVRVEVFMVDNDGKERLEEMFSAKGEGVTVNYSKNADLGSIRHGTEPVVRYDTGGRHVVLRVDVEGRNTP